MITYLDTAAFVPLLVDEQATEGARHLWLHSDRLVSTRLLYVEAVAALTRRGAKAFDREVWKLFQRIEVIELDELLMRASAVVSHRFNLRGYDSVHCAAAASIADDEMVAATSDQRLLLAWQQLGLNTYDPSA